MTEKSEKGLDYLQSIISRMASNSTNCKTWTITISAALLAFFLQDKSKILSWNKYYILLILIPFLFLDIYYLAFEKHFRNLFNDQIKLYNEQKNILVEIKGPKGFVKNIKLLLSSSVSFSVWGFYILSAFIIALILFLSS
ncbi:MAG: hypothetical protein ABSG94_04630 [Brevinematales bacterium]|jgi:hypothetical protein